jgi:hypothetical protein
VEPTAKHRIRSDIHLTPLIEHDGVEVLERFGQGAHQVRAFFRLLTDKTKALGIGESWF